MQTTSNAATLNKNATKTGPEKLSERLAEKRRALGRGLDSLLPGPRAVPTAPFVPPVVAPSVPRNVGPAPSSAHGSGVTGVPANPLPTEAAPAVPDAEVARPRASVDGDVIHVAIEHIDHNPHQTRKEFDSAALKDLSDSIQVQGVLQPIVVRPGDIGPDSEQRFILILGERRLRASKLAGKTTIPAIIKRVSEQQAAEMTLVENLQRQDLDCLEQAAAFANLSTEFHLTQEEIGKRVGVSREQVSNYLRLLKLPPDVLTALRQGDLTYSHARLLLSLRDDAQISKVAQVVISKKMSVALLQDMIMEISLPSAMSEEHKPGGARWIDPNVRAAQRSLETILGMRVRIRDHKGKGKITIEYGTLEDFDRVVTMLQGK